MTTAPNWTLVHEAETDDYSDFTFEDPILGWENTETDTWLALTPMEDGDGYEVRGANSAVVMNCETVEEARAKAEKWMHETPRPSPMVG
jgi:hypothetical protein